MNPTADRPAPLERPTGAKKVLTWAFNPFYYIAGGPACALGILVMVLAEAVGILAHARFDGVLDLHSYRSAPLWVRGVEVLVDWLALGFALLIPAKLLSGSRGVRTIDILGTQALARFPFLFAVLLATLPGVERTTDRIDQALQQGVMDMSVLAGPMADTIQFLTFAIAIVVLMVWLVALMYRAYAFSSNLRGAKAVVSFIAALIAAEVLSKIVLAVCLTAVGATPASSAVRTDADAAARVAQESSVAPGDAASPVALAQKMVGALGRGDMAAASEDFDATMRNALPPDKLKVAWELNTAKGGAFQSQLNTKTVKVKDYDLVFVNCHFTNEDLALQVTVTHDGKVSGFFVRPKF